MAWAHEYHLEELGIDKIYQEVYTEEITALKTEDQGIKQQSTLTLKYQMRKDKLAKE